MRMDLSTPRGNHENAGWFGAEKSGHRDRGDSFFVSTLLGLGAMERGHDVKGLPVGFLENSHTVDSTTSFCHRDFI
jgi:hypothetical protein